MKDKIRSFSTNGIRHLASDEIRPFSMGELGAREDYQDLQD